MGSHEKSGLYFLEQSQSIAVPKYMVSSPMETLERELHALVRKKGGLGLILKPMDFELMKAVARETLEQGTSATYEAYARSCGFVE